MPKDLPRELRATPDCIPCSLRQVLSCARCISDDEWFHGKVVKEVMAKISGIDLARSPAEVSFEALSHAIMIFGGQDPFAADKRESTERMTKLMPDLRHRIAESSDPVGLASKLAIAANIIDLGILPGVDADSEIASAIGAPLAIDDRAAFKDAVRAARTVFYLLDNAGEIVLDKLLIEQFKRKEVTCLVRASPILNDVTAEDAEAVGITEVARVVDPGAPMLGLVLNHASAEVRELFATADVVISKGQANFETLSGAEREVFFLLRAKCPVVARALGVEVGAAVLTRHEPAGPELEVESAPAGV